MALRTQKERRAVGTRPSNGAAFIISITILSRVLESPLRWRFLFRGICGKQ